MAKKKLGVVRSGILKLKLKAPKGIKLTDAETAAVIDIWRSDAKLLDKNHDRLEDVADDLERNLNRVIPDALQETVSARNEAARYFKVTKDPIKKREWARRLVLADTAQKSISASQKRMTVMVDRVKTLVADASLEKAALDVRISEAEMYHKMGDGLKLVGEALVNARSRAKSMSIEFSNLELMTEGVEKTVKRTSDEKIIQQANTLIGEGN